MRISRRGFDIGVGLALLLLGAFVWREGANVPPSFLDTAFGTGYLPMLAGASLCVLACFLVVEAMRDRSGAAAFALDAHLVRPALTTLALSLFVLNLTVGWVPFYPASAILIFAIAVGLGERSRREIAISAACALLATLAAWFVFTRVFVVLIG